MSFKVVKKTTYIITTPEGEQTLTEQELVAKLGQAREKARELQRFITDVEAIVSPGKMLNQAIRFAPLPSATALSAEVKKVFSALTHNMTVNQLIPATGLKDSIIRRCLEELLFLGMVQRVKEALGFSYRQRPVLTVPPKPDKDSVCTDEDAPDLSSLAKEGKAVEALRRDK